MTTGVNTIHVGDVIHYKGQLWLVLKQDHVKPGKGGAFVNLEMKDIIHGTKLIERFRSSDTVEKAFLEDKKYQYQYTDGNDLALMDMETYEQVMVDKSLLGDAEPFLQDGMEVTVKYCEDKPISLDLPETVELEIAEADPVVKGQTAAASFKPAKLENGVRTMVPPFIESGDRVVVRTTDGSYVERAKK